MENIVKCLHIFFFYIYTFWMKVAVWGKVAENENGKRHGMVKMELLMQVFNTNGGSKLLSN